MAYLMRVLAVSLVALVLSSSLHGAPFQVSHPGTIVSAPHLRYGGKAARNDAGVRLVVWSDTRPGDRAVSFNSRSVRGALVDPVWSPVVDFEIARAVTPGSSGRIEYRSDVEVASEGQDFLVAYNIGTPSQPPLELNTHLTVVASDGRVEASPEVIPGALVSMTATLGHYFVTTIDHSLDTVQLTILNRNGRIVRSGLPITPREKPGARMAALHSLRDGRLLVLWNGIRSTTLDVAIVHPYLLFQRDYNGLTTSARIEAVDATAAVAEGRDRLLIVESKANEPTVTSAAIDRSGELLFREDYAEFGYRWITQMAVTSTANGFVALANNVFFPTTGQSAAIFRFSADGRRTGTVDRVFGKSLENVAPLVNEEGLALFVTTGTYARPTVELNHVVSGGWTILTVSRSLPAQEDAVAAQCRGITTIAWREVSAEGSIVRFRRFGADGTPLDPPNRGVAIPAGAQSRPAVTCGRRTTLVSWREEPAFRTEQYRGLLLFDSGESFDLGVLALGYNSKVVSDGTSYVVLSHLYESGPTPPRLTRWSDDGRWLGIRELPELTGRVHLTFALASNGESLLLTWVETVKQESTLYAQPVSRSFALVGAPVQLTDRLPSHLGVYTLAVTASPQGWLTGWRLPATGGCAAFTFRLGRDGSPFDPRGGVLNNAASRECDVLQLGWNGAEYEVLTEATLAARGTDGSIAVRAAADPGEQLAAVTFGSRRLLVSSFIEPASAVRLLYAEPIP